MPGPPPLPLISSPPWLGQTYGSAGSPGGAKDQSRTLPAVGKLPYLEPMRTTTPVAGAKPGKDGSTVLKVGRMTIVVLPDARSEDPSVKAVTVFKPEFGSRGKKHGTPPDLVWKDVGARPVKVTFQTVYGPGVSPTDGSSYGRGTTTEDVTAKNTTIEFHEARHGEFMVDYLKTHPPPSFAGTEGMSDAEFKKASAKYNAEMDEYFATMEAESTKTGDCVGTPADFCPTTPTPPSPTSPAPNR